MSHDFDSPRRKRPATKHTSDLLDLFRLVEVYNTEGELSRELRESPTDLGRIIADFAHRAVLANVTAATRHMASTSAGPSARAGVASRDQMTTGDRRWSRAGASS